MLGLIVAYDKNRVIGNKGKIPWRIPGEQRRFKELTTGNVVIMGRRSYEEIGRPLPNRENIIISNTKQFQGERLYTAGSLQEALKLAEQFTGDCYIAGGGRLYQEALPLVEKMFITEVEWEVPEGDTYFPEFDSASFVRQVEEEVPGDIPYRYVTYTRKE